MSIILFLLCIFSCTAIADDGKLTFPSMHRHVGQASARMMPEDDRVEFPWLTDHDQQLSHDTHTSEENKEIPHDVLLRLNTIQNITELEDIVADETSDEDSGSELLEIDTRFGPDEENVERKAAAAVMAEPAICTPRPTVVQLKHSKDKRYVYYPSCTTVNLCGGCCLDLMECQPTETETLYFKLIRYGYKNNKLIRKAREIVPVEQHVSCECGCRVQEKHCNKSIHEYRPETCECACINTDERQKCEAENYTKIWDPTTCSCVCLNKQICSTGRLFNERTCSCELERRRRVSGNEVNAEYLSRRRDRNTMPNTVPRTVNPL